MTSFLHPVVLQTVKCEREIWLYGYRKKIQ